MQSTRLEEDEGSGLGAFLSSEVPCSLQMEASGWAIG